MAQAQQAIHSRSPVTIHSRIPEAQNVKPNSSSLMRYFDPLDQQWSTNTTGGWTRTAIAGPGLGRERQIHCLSIYPLPPEFFLSRNENPGLLRFWLIYSVVHYSDYKKGSIETVIDPPAPHPHGPHPQTSEVANTQSQASRGSWFETCSGVVPKAVPLWCGQRLGHFGSQLQEAMCSLGGWS